MRPLLLPSLAVVATSLAFAGIATGQSADLTGSWRHSGSQTELVVQPQIRLQPYVVPGYGTSLGGSVGYGSATNTTIVTEAAPVRVTRNMSLEIRSGGGATWRIEKRQPAGRGCEQTISQVKTGRIALAGARLTFRVSEGTETVRSTCAAASSRAIPASVEEYQAERRGRSLALTSGGSTWVFDPN